MKLLCYCVKQDVAKGLFKLDPRNPAAKAKASQGPGRKPVSDDEDDDGPKRGSKKKEDRRKKAASGKAGGGAQGRETKTKSTKKKYLAGRGAAAESDDEDGFDEEGEGSAVALDEGPEFTGQKDLVEKVKGVDVMAGAPGLLAEKLATELKR